MADFAATLLQDFVIDYREKNNLDSKELNTAAVPLIDLALRQNLFDTEAVRNAKQNVTHVVKQPVINKSTAAIVDEFKLVVPTNTLVSAFETYTFTGYGFSIEMFPENFADNYIKYQAAFNEKMRRGLEGMSTLIETEKVVNLLDANKNTYWDAAVTGLFTGGQIADVLQVSAAEAEEAYTKFQSIFNFSDFPENELDVAASTFHEILIRQLGGQGEGNAINKRFQLSDYKFNFANRIPQVALSNATAYIMNSDTIGMTHWLPKASTMKLQTLGGGAQWGTSETMPILGMPVGTFFRDEVIDTNVTAINGGGSGTTQRQTFQFLTYVTSKATYNSAPASRFNPILKVNFTTA